MKFFLLLLVFSLNFVLFMGNGHAAKAAGKNVVMAVIDDEPRDVFEQRTLVLIKNELRNCTNCEVRNFTPYDKDGQFLESQLADSILQASKTANFLYLSWNRPMAADHKKISDNIKAAVKEGFLIVSVTGAAGADQSTLPLNRTVVGQITGVIIIGELVERENLLAKSYFGPEMLTAVRAPKEHLGQGYAPLFFASRLASRWHSKESDQWSDHFTKTRLRSRKLWPNIEDFF